MNTAATQNTYFTVLNSVNITHGHAEKIWLSCMTRSIAKEKLKTINFVCEMWCEANKKCKLIWILFDPLDFRFSFLFSHQTFKKKGEFILIAQLKKNNWSRISLFMATISHRVFSMPFCLLKISRKSFKLSKLWGF